LCKLSTVAKVPYCEHAYEAHGYAAGAVCCHCCCYGPAPLTLGHLLLLRQWAHLLLLLLCFLLLLLLAFAAWFSLLLAELP